jgi:choline dehydrogenase-like flavoprotein
VPVAPSARLADDVAPPPEVRPADERRSSRVREELEQAGRTWAAGKEGERRLRVLEALCDTWVPAVRPPRAAGDLGGFWQRRASDLGVHLLMAGWFATHADPEDVEEVLPLFDLLAATGFTRLPAPARAAELKVLAKANAEIDEGLEDLRKLALMLHYAVPDASGSNPAWPIFGYPGPPEVAPLEGEGLTTLDVAPAEAPLVLEADVVVVGSGAGGGVVAGELAGAGLDVVVLEMGEGAQESSFPRYELEAMTRLYWRGGYTARTEDRNVTLMAGATLGGGTTVNWTNCVQPPDRVRKSWAGDHGLAGLDTTAFDEHLDAVAERIGAVEDCSDYNGPNDALRRGAEAHGWSWKTARRNTDVASYDPVTAGHMGYGDPTGSKQGTLRTYLRDAVRDGARILTRCRADRILVEGGRATGVAATLTHADGRTTAVTVRARTVVVAGGALETPALLLRSAIGGPAVGRHFRLHPVTALIGMYPEEQRSWWGPPQSVIVDEFSDATEGYGFLLECPHYGAGLSAGSLPWRSGREHKVLIGRLRHASTFIGLVRDRGEGRITIDDGGEAVVHYPLIDTVDRVNLQRTLGVMARAHAAAGARAILDLHPKQPFWRRGRDLDGWIDEIAELPMGSGGRPLFSAHQMGSARMGTDPTRSVADPEGQLHDTPGVWIGDTSAFPTAVGSNPMLTCMALARRTAHAIVAARS